MTHVRPGKIRLWGAWIAAGVDLATGTVLLLLEQPATGTGLWFLSRFFFGGMIAAGVLFAVHALRLARGIDFDDTMVRQGSRVVHWNAIGAVRLIRMGSNLSLRGRDDERLMSVAVGDWPEDAVLMIIEKALSALRSPPLPWKDEQGGDCLQVDHDGLTVRRGGRTEVVGWHDMAAVELRKHAAPKSYVVLRLRVSKRDGTILYPALSRTDEIALYQVLVRGPAST